MAIRIAIAAVVILGIVITVGSGFRALVVYAFFVGLAAAIAFAAGLGGDWIKDASRRRFDDRHR